MRPELSSVFSFKNTLIALMVHCYICSECKTVTVECHCIALKMIPTCMGIIFCLILFTVEVCFAEIDCVNVQTFSGDCCENGGQAVYDSSAGCIPISCSGGGNHNM